MFNVRSAVLGAAMASSLGLGGCAKEKAKTAGSQTPEATADTGTTQPVVPLAPATPPPPKVKVRASLEGLGDMMDATKVIVSNIDPEKAIDPRAQLGALLLGSGFGPGFLSNIDLDGVHAFSFAVPPKGSESIGDLELAGAIAVRNGRAVLEAMPASFQPQPLGDGAWELRLDDALLMLKEGPGELRLGFTAQDLAVAAELDRRPSPGRRIRARAENLPMDLMSRDRAPWIAQIPGLEKVVADTKAVELEFDYGTDRALQLLTTVIAPFHLLGVEPIGRPRETATALEQRLPADPFFAATMSWGDPTLVHSSIDRMVPLDQIPDPFGQIAQQAVKGVHGLLDQISNDVVMALYVGKNGDATFLVAADVKADAETAAGLRQVSDSIVQALEAYAIMQGKNEDAKFKIEFKSASVPFGKIKADRMTVRIPKDFRSDFDTVETFIDKDSIEIISWVSGQTAVLAVGAGAKTIAGDIAKSLGKPRKASLAQDQGLQGIRTAMNGCQLCASFDIVDYLRFRLQLLGATHPKDKEVQKKTKAMLAALAKAKVEGEPSLGIRVEREQGAIGMYVPKSLVFTGHDAIEVLTETNEYVDGGVAAEPEPKQPSRPREAPAPE